MADTRVTTTGDRRVTTTADVRVTTDGSETLVVFSQSVRRYGGAETLVTFSQKVGAFGGPDTLATFKQAVRKNPVFGDAETLATIDQSVVFLREGAAETLVTLSQTVERRGDAETLVTLRQIVLSPVVAAENTTFIYLDGVEVTAQTSPALNITATESDNRTAAVRLYLPLGPVNITGYQGRELIIQRLINGSLVTLFTGTVDRPVYDHESRSIRLECSDLRNERVGREDQAQLQQMTGGLFSPVTQNDDAEGEQWVGELLRTVAGSLDYTGAGTLRYRPWAVASPRYVLTDEDVHHRDVSMEFATRSEVVNRVDIAMEYRWYQRRTLEHTVSAQMRRSNYGSGATGTGTKIPHPDDVIPSRDALISAVQSVGEWRTVSYTVASLPDSGWYRDPFNLEAGPVGWVRNEVVAETKGMGITARLERYISQPKRESYRLSVTAPQSVDQFGEIQGSTLRFSLESRIDPSVFESRGCSVGPEDDRRAELNAAIQAAWRMAQKELLSGHRRNYCEFAIEADPHHERDLLPVEIGDTIQLSTGPVDVVGWVTEFSHTLTREGFARTSIKLAVSRVDSEEVVVEDWSIPAVPSSYSLNAESQALPETPDCPALEDEAAVEGPSRVESNGSAIIVAPSVDRSLVDEIIGTRERDYPLEIPVNQFDVEVI